MTVMISILDFRSVGIDRIIEQGRVRQVGQLALSRLYRFPNGTPSFDVYRYRGAERVRSEQRARSTVFYCHDSLVGPHAEAAVCAGERTAAEVLATLATR